MCQAGNCYSMYIVSASGRSPRAWPGAALLILLLAACPAETEIGIPCMKNGDCVGGERKQICAVAPAKAETSEEGRVRMCTRGCDTRKDCPLGFECLYRPDADMKACFPCVSHEDCPAGSFCTASGTTDGGTAILLCQPKQIERGDFGKDCSKENDPACGAAQGFFCHGEVIDDPAAYCTRKCTDDADCYPSMFCGSVVGDEYFPVEGRRRCLKRSLCSSCRSDSECTEESPICVRDKRGRGYCTRQCDPDSPKPCTIASGALGHLECLEVVRDLTRPQAEQQLIAACAPRYGRDDEHPQGRCYGAGNTCDPCRPHLPGDCKRGTQCVRNEKTDEWLCRQPCERAADCKENPALPDVTFRCIQYTASDFACSVSATVGNITCWR